MAIDIRSIQNIVAGVVEDSPLPERLADLHPQLLDQVTTEARSEGISPDAYWRHCRARQAKEQSQIKEAGTNHSPSHPPIGRTAAPAWRFIHAGARAPGEGLPPPLAGGPVRYSFCLWLRRAF